MTFERNSNKFNFSLWDVTKSIGVIFLCVMLWLNVPKFMDNMNGGYDETTVERIAANIVKVHLAESDKDLKELIGKLAEANSVAIQLSKDNDEKILEVAKIVGTLKSTVNTDPGVDVIHDGPKEDTRVLHDFVVEREASDGEKFPTAIVYFSPNAVEESKFTTQAFPLDFNVVIVESESDEGQERYVELWVENNFVKSSKGKKFPIDLKSVEWAKGKEQDKRFRWSPRLGFSGIIGIDDIYPAFDVSLFSYGRTKRDMDWRFLDIALGGTKDEFYIGLQPFSYNIGNIIPMVENMFLGPSISIDSKAKQTYGVGISIPF